jgi:hypothetical protein
MQISPCLLRFFTDQFALLYHTLIVTSKGGMYMQPVKSLVRDNNNLQGHSSANDMRQALEFQTQNNVRITHNEDARIDGQVADPVTNQTHNATLTSSDFGLSWQCTCGSNGGTAGGGNMCPHALATALTAQ